MSELPMCERCGSPQFSLIHATVGPDGGCIASLRAQLGKARGDVATEKARAERAEEERAEIVERIAIAAERAGVGDADDVRNAGPWEAIESLANAAHRATSAESDRDALRSDLARVTGERDEARLDAKRLDHLVDVVAAERDTREAERDAALARAEKAEAERDEVQRVFDMRNAAYHRAEERWRAEDPSRRELVLPDTSDLVHWLLEQLDAANTCDEDDEAAHVELLDENEHLREKIASAEERAALAEQRAEKAVGELAEVKRAAEYHAREIKGAFTRWYGLPPGDASNDAVHVMESHAIGIIRLVTEPVVIPNPTEGS